MNDLRTAAQQALECLKGVARGKYDGNAAEVCAALEAALAQEPTSDFERGFQRGWQRAMRDRDRDALVRAKVEAELAATVERLAQQAEPETCTWQQDGDSDSGVYGTSCGRYFSLDDGTPEDNRLAWCCYCGKRLVQELITEDDDE